MTITSNDADASQAYHARRERELASLYATARSLTALGELDEVLQSIVRHAHELIGTDFTYLSLLADDGTLSVRACEGTISADFLAARIPPRTGLGGKVIGSRTPAWVSNYMDADHLAHDRDFDHVVGREGMVALLGVPLIARGDAIGALFASDRSERSFTSEEIALFSAFADHAAVALDNARLYDESRSALHELQTAYEVIEEHVATMERAETVHEALTHVILTGGGPEEVAAQLAQQLGGTVTVLERDGSLVASSADGPPETASGPARAVVARALEQARRSGRCVTEECGPWTYSVAAVQAGKSYLGALVWARPDPPSAADVRMLERATHIVGLMTLKENALVDAAERLSGELMTELLVAGPAIGAAQRARTRARGIDIDALDLLVVADAPTVPTTVLSRQLHAFAREHSGLAGEHLGRATMLIHAADAEKEVAAAHAHVRGQVGRRVTLIGEAVQGHEWARAFSVASRCSDVVRALGTSDLGAMTGRYALYSLLFDPDRLDELDRFLDDSLGELLAYDEHRATDLVHTASAYFANQGSLARTARDLHVHMNTLLKRIDRITTILGEGWRGPDALDVQMALRLHELRAR